MAQVVNNIYIMKLLCREYKFALIQKMSIGHPKN
jgi:hypothetical protein